MPSYLIGFPASSYAGELFTGAVLDAGTLNEVCNQKYYRDIFSNLSVFFEEMGYRVYAIRRPEIYGTAIAARHLKASVADIRGFLSVGRLDEIRYLKNIRNVWLLNYSNTVAETSNLISLLDQAPGWGQRAGGFINGIGISSLVPGAVPRRGVLLPWLQLLRSTKSKLRNGPQALARASSCPLILQVGSLEQSVEISQEQLQGDLASQQTANNGPTFISWLTAEGDLPTGLAPILLEFFNFEKMGAAFNYVVLVECPAPTEGALTACLHRLDKTLAGLGFDGHQIYSSRIKLVFSPSRRASRELLEMADHYIATEPDWVENPLGQLAMCLGPELIRLKESDGLSLDALEVAHATSLACDRYDIPLALGRFTARSAGFLAPRPGQVRSLFASRHDRTSARSPHARARNIRAAQDFFDTCYSQVVDLLIGETPPQ